MSLDAIMADHDSSASSRGDPVPGLVRAIEEIDFRTCFPHGNHSKTAILTALETIPGHLVEVGCEWSVKELFKFLRRQSMANRLDEISRQDLCQSTGFICAILEAGGGNSCNMGDIIGPLSREMSSPWLRSRLPKLTRQQGVDGADYWRKCCREYVTGRQGRRIACGRLFSFFEDPLQMPADEITTDHINLMIAYGRGVTWAAGKLY